MGERVYLERGQRVTVLAWARPRGHMLRPLGEPVDWWSWPPRAPRNVLIERADGTRVVRPFRGLRKVKEAPRG